MRCGRFLRTLAAGVLLACCAAYTVEPAAAAQPRVEVTWIGGATMLIRFGELTVLTDPALGPEGFRMGDPNAADLHTVKLHRRLTPFRGVALEAVDLVLLSHAHEDHFDQQARADLDRASPIMLPGADVETVEAMGFENLDGLDWGETRELDAGTGRIRITVTDARHSRDPGTAEMLGVGNGYWLEFSAGDWQWTMYWTGDTLPTPEVVQAIKASGQPNLMVPHVGGVGTGGPLGRISMGAADVITLADEVRPERILPIHHSTYGFYREPISELVTRSRGKPYRLVIAEGTTTVYD